MSRFPYLWPDDLHFVVCHPQGVTGPLYTPYLTPLSSTHFLLSSENPSDPLFSFICMQHQSFFWGGFNPLTASNDLISDKWINKIIFVRRHDASAKNHLHIYLLWCTSNVVSNHVYHIHHQIFGLLLPCGCTQHSASKYLTSDQCLLRSTLCI